jgi:hypothetical protein
MTEREMEDLLWEHPEKLLGEPLAQFRRQPSSEVGRADLVFTDSLDRLLVVEIKHGVLPRGAITQLNDYFGMMKQRYPDKPVELMVVANQIPEERRLACERLHIETKEISEKRFRDVAAEVDYEFGSEVRPEPPAGHSDQADQGRAPAETVATGPATSFSSLGRARKAWYHWRDEDQAGCFLAFVNAKGSCSMRVFAEADGLFLDKQYRSGDFQDNFKDYVEAGTAISLGRQPNLDRDCSERLPDVVLQELKAGVGGGVEPNEARGPEGLPEVDDARSQPSGAVTPVPSLPRGFSGSSRRVRKAWYHWIDESQSGFFLAFVNAKGSCSMRAFSQDDGRFLDKQYRSGDFQENFGSYIAEGSPLSLRRQPNLDRDCADCLPSQILQELKAKLAGTPDTSSVQSAAQALEFVNSHDYPSETVRLFVQSFLQNAAGHSERISFEANDRRLVWYDAASPMASKRIGRILLTVGTPDILVSDGAIAACPALGEIALPERHKTQGFMRCRPNGPELARRFATELGRFLATQ